MLRVLVGPRALWIVGLVAAAAGGGRLLAAGGEGGASDVAPLAPNDGGTAAGVVPPESPNPPELLTPNAPSGVPPRVAGPGVGMANLSVVRADPAFPLLAPPVPLAPEAPDGRPALASDVVALAELQPMFASGDLAEAKQAFDNALYPQALAMLDAQARKAKLPPEARFLRGVALLRVGLSAQAAQELLAVAELLPSLRDRCLFSAAVALEDQHAYAQAADLYGDVTKQSPSHRDAQLGQARMVGALGQWTRGLEVLAPLTSLPAPGSGFGRDLGAEALFSSAQLEERHGLSKKAWQHDRELWIKHPLSPIADAANARATALGAPPPTAAEKLARAELVLAANKNQDAIAALKPLAAALKLKPPAKKPVAEAATPDKGLALACQAHFALGKALKKQRHHVDALVEFGQVLNACHGPDFRELHARTLYLAGQSAAVVDPPRAKALFSELSEGAPENSFADDALFFAADVEAKNLGDPAAAKASLEALVARYPSGDYADEARFKLFWLARQAQAANEGVAELKTLVDQASPSAPREPEPLLRARYWLDVTQGDAGGLAQLAEAWPANYYSDLARVALPADAGVTVSPPAGPSAPPPLALHGGSLLKDPNFLAGLTLLRLGLNSAADEELSRVDRAAITGPSGRGEPLLLLSLALSRAGDARTAHGVAKALVESGGAFPLTTPGRDGLIRLLFEVAYPRAFRPAIEHWSQAANVPPDLLQGLMREESALDPNVLSGAGAVGLCQLMPATGKLVARRLGLGNISAQALQNPDLNIRLGAAYLGELLKRYNGRQPLAVAAYNAGEGAVDKWLAAAKGEPLDAFAEDIPIAETRHYVKRVLTSAAVYRTLGESGTMVAGR